jgi:hypothetical protein
MIRRHNGRPVSNLPSPTNERIKMAQELFGEFVYEEDNNQDEELVK